MKKLGLLTLLVAQSAGLLAQWNNTVPVNADDYFKIRFTSASTGYVLRNENTAATILKTSNAAATWTPCSLLPANHSIRDFHFINDNTGFVVSDSGGFSSTKIHVFKTVNGGVGWTKISVIDSAVAYGPSVHFSDALHGTITETYGVIYTTVNGGATWTKNVYNSEMFMDMEFPTPAVGYIGCWDGTFAYIGSVFKSTDSGATWNVVHTFPDNYTAIDLLSFVDASNGYASMTDYSIYKTNDGGLSWDSLLYFQQNSVDVMDMFFTSINTGYAVDGFGNIFKTTDGAQTWQVDFPEDSVGIALNSIIINGSTGYACGYDGHVLKRDNINGINENKTTLQTRVYPNPSNGVLQVLINSPQKATLTVFNAAGETVSERAGFLSGTLDLSHLVNGLYYLHVTMQNGETTNQRILISR